MDVFVEQLFKRKNKKLELALKFGVYAVCGLLAGFIMLIFLTAIDVRLFPIGLIFAGGLLYLAYYMSGQLNIEFEYILTNGTFDVDAIINMKKRKRLASLDCSNVEDIGKYVSDRKYNCNGIVFAANEGSDNLFYMIFQHKEKGRILLVIDPDDKMIDGLKKCLPRRLTTDLF